MPIECKIGVLGTTHPIGNVSQTADNWCCLGKEHCHADECVGVRDNMMLRREEIVVYMR